MAAPRLACPHCGGAVSANPIGHWFQRFQCPHCRRALQFDARTNTLGMVGVAWFAAMVVCAWVASAPWMPWLAAGFGALWAASLALSYILRGVTKA